MVLIHINGKLYIDTGMYFKTNLSDDKSCRFHSMHQTVEELIFLFIVTSKH